MEYDVFADYHINMFCNFDCKYCYIQSKRKKDAAYGEKDINRIIKGFNAPGITWLINITGGEPFLQPNFVRLCRELTKKHHISVTTNLASKYVYDFAEQVSPNRVAWVHCSVHIEERERLGLVEDFIEKYRWLKRHNFNTCVTQVAYPAILRRFGEIYDSFKKRGIIVRPKVLKGAYRLRLYPADYTKQEREEIARHFELAEKADTFETLHFDPSLDKKFLYGSLSFAGCLCRAGKDFVVIKRNGDVVRCLEKHVKLGNLFQQRIKLFQEARPCSGGICVSPRYGLLFAEGTPRVVKSHSIIERMKPAAKRLITLLR